MCLTDPNLLKSASVIPADLHTSDCHLSLLLPMDTNSGIYVQDYNQWTTEASKYKNTTFAKLLHHNHHRAYNAQAHKSYHGDTI